MFASLSQLVMAAHFNNYTFWEELGLPMLLYHDETTVYFAENPAHLLRYYCGSYDMMIHMLSNIYLDLSGMRLIFTGSWQH